VLFSIQLENLTARDQNLGKIFTPRCTFSSAELTYTRLLKETGRYSNSPVFVVGIYSGEDKLGEGFGSSLKMAEYRAAEDALHRLYLTQTPSHALRLPSTTLPDPRGVFEGVEQHLGLSMEYTPGELGEAEVLFGSSGRSGLRSSLP
jgi:large subunit ribosomal protein L44